MLAAMRAFLIPVMILTATTAVAAPRHIQQVSPPSQSHQDHDRQQPAQPEASPQHSSRSSRSSGIDTIPKDRAAATYAIYSLITPGSLIRKTSTGSTTRWAIAKQTVSFADMNPRIDPRGALKPPPGDEKAFHQAVQDFERLRYLHFRLERHFRLGHPYTLLDAEQIRQLRAAKTSAYPGSTLRNRYAGYAGITFFSAVYFSDNQQAALVYRNDWCGVFCNQAQWFYFEKKNGHWQQMSGMTVPGI